MHEAMSWHGRLLLHRDISVPGQRLALQAVSQRLPLVDEGDDVTRKEDVQPDTAVGAFWESIGSPFLYCCPRSNAATLTPHLPIALHATQVMSGMWMLAWPPLWRSTRAWRPKAIR